MIRARKSPLFAAFAALTVVFTLSSCAPVAQAVVNAIDNSDGATLTYTLNRDPRGVTFDPGPALARGVIVRLEGDALQVLAVPDGATCTVEVTADASQADCRLGDVTEPVFIGVAGANIAGNATWRRAGSSTVYLTFARMPGEE